MNAERLLAHYERIADAPDANARLRRFILDLAVRGKLVPQDPKDEPASELLTQIVAEKERLVNTGERKEKPLSEIDPGEVPFDSPHGWEWVRIRSVTCDRGQTVPDRDFTYIDVTAINNEAGRIEEAKVTSASDAPSRARKIVCKGDVLYSCVRPYLLNVAIVETEFSPAPIASTAFAVLNGFGLILPRYQWIVLRSPFMVACVEEKMRGQAYPAINDAEFSLLPFPLPPLAEQRRIVGKVDELMALCDRLEAARARREAMRDQLTVASLARLNTPDLATFYDDARYAIDTLPALTTRPNQIKQLRQTILNLAVRGKLVPQDPKDEPASELLKRIHLDRKYKRQYSQIDEDELENPLPTLPPKWTWATADEISDDDENAITDGPFGSQLKTDHYISAPGFRVVRLQNIGSGVFREEHRSYIDQSRFHRLSKHHVKAGDLVVAGLVDPQVRCCEVPANIGPALVKADCYRFAVHSKLSPRFALHFLNSSIAQDFAAVHHHGMTLTRIGLGNFRRIPIPLPPVAEQHRIVAKVDELMALCKRLEASLATGEDIRRRLLEVLLHEALAPSYGLVAEQPERIAARG